MEWFENDDFWRDFYPFMFSDERFAATPDEVSRILALTQCSGGDVLDLCCGPGRHSVELAQRGFKVTGVDRSPFLLEKARDHAAKSGAAVEWVNQDMRELFAPPALISPAASSHHSDTLKMSRMIFACCATSIKA
jgi:SAM-dependent methyltransferase